MPLFFRLAWRNVTRNRRRTLITLAAISSGLAAVILFFGLSNGFHDQWITNSVRIYTGHVSVYAKDYRDERNLNRSIADLDELNRFIYAVPGLENTTARVHVSGLVSTARSSSMSVIRGIDPEGEARITGLRESIVEGEYLDATTERQILIGHKMAERLNASLGEKIVLMVQAADGSIGAELFYLKGIFRLGAVDLDGSLAIARIADVQNLAAMGGKVTEAVLILDSPGQATVTATQLAKELSAGQYEVLTWDEVLPQARQMIALSNVFTYVLLVIILGVVSLGILNTMLMSIMERTREFGIMRAMGTRPGQIVSLVLLEALCLALLGTGLGIALGLGVNTLLGLQGIDLSRWSEAMDLVSSLKPVIYPSVESANVLIAALAALLSTLLAAIYPALRAARLRPVDAIRSL
jgi:ABC-type lipoprotein release transport system permease subunit